MVARRGDTIELGLSIHSHSPSDIPRTDTPPPPSRAKAAPIDRSTPPTLADPGAEAYLCVFEIVHDTQHVAVSAATTPKAEIHPYANLKAEEYVRPKLDSLLLRRLLQRQNAALHSDLDSVEGSTEISPRHIYQIRTVIPRGPPILEPPRLSAEEEAVRQPFPSLTLAREPTLSELSSFTESLRGRKVLLHSSLSSYFARHLTTYLIAWGMDVSHVGMERGDDTFSQADQKMAMTTSGSTHDIGEPEPTSATSDLSRSLSSVNIGVPLRDIDKFIVIDDDVSVLRRELVRLKHESPTTALKKRLLRRPNMPSRAKSSPQVRQTFAGRQSSSILIHFTSLGNFNQVRDALTIFLGSPAANVAGMLEHPEVMVIPKPVGPRRFLTALHTAVNQPIVDPFFTPIASSPRSPSGGVLSVPRGPFASEIANSTGFFDSIAENSGEDEYSRGSEGTASIKARSPLGEFPPSTSHRAGLHLTMPTPIDWKTTPASEYFAQSRSGSASAVVLQSPDGQPRGMAFEPPARASDSRHSSASQRVTPDRYKGANRNSIGAEEVSASTSPHIGRKLSTPSDEKNSSSRTSEDNNVSRRRKTMPTPNESSQARERASTLTRTASMRRKTTGASPTVGSSRVEEVPAVSSPVKTPRQRRAGSSSIRAGNTRKNDELLVPPINVLVVEGEMVLRLSER